MGAILESGDIMHFVKQHVNSPLKAELLVFLSRNPNGRFCVRVITGALRRSRRNEVQEALRDLAEAGLVEEALHMGSRPCYSLTRQEEMRQPVLSLAGCSLGEIRSQLNYAG